MKLNFLSPSGSYMAFGMSFCFEPSLSSERRESQFFNPSQRISIFQFLLPSHYIISHPIPSHPISPSPASPGQPSHLSEGDPCQLFRSVAMFISLQTGVCAAPRLPPSGQSLAPVSGPGTGLGRRGVLWSIAQIGLSRH